MLSPFHWLGRRPARKPFRRHTSKQLWLERLEERVVPSVLLASFDKANYSIFDNQSPATLTVTLADSASGRPTTSQHLAVSVHYSATGGTATQPADYTLQAGTLNFG